MRTLIAVIVGGALVLSGPMLLHAQSLAEVARKEQERRKSLPPNGGDHAGASKVYTNKDLKPVPPVASAAAPKPDPAAHDSGTAPGIAAATPAPDAASAPPPPAAAVQPADPGASAAAGAAAGTLGAPGGTDGAVKDREYWSRRMQSLQAMLDRDEVYAAALQTRVNSLTADFTARDDPAQRSVIAADRQKTVDTLQRLTQAIAGEKRALAAFEEEARRAGVPPGWLR